MGVFTLLNRRTAVVHCIEQFVREPVFHRVLATLAGGIDQPADRQGLAPFCANLHRHLIGRTADAAGPHLNRRLHVVQSLMEHAYRIGLRTATPLHHVERAIHGTLGNRLLAVVHQRIHEARDDDVAELGIRQDFAFDGTTTTTHVTLTSAAWRRTANGAGVAWQCPACRVRRAGCDSARRAGPLRGRPGSAPRCVPAGCVPHLGYRTPPHSRWSALPSPPCPAPSSASSAWSYRRAYIRPASADSLAVRAPCS